MCRASNHAEKRSETVFGLKNRHKDTDRHNMMAVPSARETRSVIVLWSAVGFGVGIFWFALALVFFTAPNGLFVTVVFDYVAVITCPPLFFGNYFIAPFLNAALYGLVAYGIGRVRARNRH
jgi:hypothetical protein